jgi:hypothetical protein
MELIAPTALIEPVSSVIRTLQLACAAYVQFSRRSDSV